MANWVDALAQNPQLLQMYLGMYQNGQSQVQNSRMQQQQYALAQQQQVQNTALSQEYQKQQDLAKQANESRYMDILSLLGGGRDRALGDLANYGQSQITDVNAAYDTQSKNANADLMGRGLYASTIGPSVQAGIERERQRSLGAANDQIINRRVNTDMGLTGNIAGVMERRNDVPPDLSQLIALQNGLGQGGYGAMNSPVNMGLDNRGYGAMNSPVNMGLDNRFGGLSYNEYLRRGGRPVPGGSPNMNAMPAGGGRPQMPPGFMAALNAMAQPQPQMQSRTQTQGMQAPNFINTGPLFGGTQAYQAPPVGSSAMTQFGGTATTLPYGSHLASPALYSGYQQPAPWLQPYNVPRPLQRQRAMRGYGQFGGGPTPASFPSKQTKNPFAGIIFDRSLPTAGSFVDPRSYA